MFTRLMNRIFMPNLFKMDAEYCERFYKPLKERGDALGIPDSEFDVMWKFAWQAAEPIVVGLAPGSIMRNLIDHWEADRVSCMQFITDESKSLGYKYTPPEPATAQPAAGEDRYLIQRKELDAYKRALKDMIAAYDEVTGEYGE